MLNYLGKKVKLDYCLIKLDVELRETSRARTYRHARARLASLYSYSRLYSVHLATGKCDTAILPCNRTMKVVI